MTIKVELFYLSQNNYMYGILKDTYQGRGQVPQYRISSVFSWPPFDGWKVGISGLWTIDGDLARSDLVRYMGQHYPENCRIMFDLAMDRRITIEDLYQYDPLIGENVSEYCELLLARFNPEIGDNIYGSVMVYNRND